MIIKICIQIFALTYALLRFLFQSVVHKTSSLHCRFTAAFDHEVVQLRAEVARRAADRKLCGVQRKDDPTRGIKVEV